MSATLLVDIVRLRILYSVELFSNHRVSQSIPLLNNDLYREIIHSHPLSAIHIYRIHQSTFDAH